MAGPDVPSVRAVDISRGDIILAFRTVVSPPPLPPTPARSGLLLSGAVRGVIGAASTEWGLTDALHFAECCCVAHAMQSNATQPRAFVRSGQV